MNKTRSKNQSTPFSLNTLEPGEMLKWFNIVEKGLPKTDNLELFEWLKAVHFVVKNAIPSVGNVEVRGALQTLLKGIEARLKGEKPAGHVVLGG